MVVPVSIGAIARFPVASCAIEMYLVSVVTLKMFYDIWIIGSFPAVYFFKL